MSEILLDNMLPFIGGGICLFYAYYGQTHADEEHKPDPARTKTLILCGIVLLAVSIGRCIIAFVQ